MKPIAISTVLFGFVCGFVVCLGSPLDGAAADTPAEVRGQAGGDLREMIEWYRADLRSVKFRYDVPMSIRRRDRLDAFYAEWLAKLGEVEFSQLSQDGKIDYLLFRNELTYQRTQLEIEETKDAQISKLLPFAGTIVGLAEGQEDVIPVDGEAAARALHLLTKNLESLNQRLRDPEQAAELSVSATQAIRAARRTDELNRALAKWFRFYEGYDPIFTWWVKAPYQDVSIELTAYADRIRRVLAGIDENDSEKIVGEPIGHEALMAELRFEMVPYSPEELIAIAQEQFAWCDAEMLKAAKEMGFGEDWKAAQEAVKELHVQPGDQPEMIRGLAVEAVEFLEARDLVTIPELCKEAWRMEMMSPARQKVSPYFLGGETIMVSFPTDSMSHPDKLMSMRGNNVHFSRATVQHELIPGHHLQGYMTKRYRPYRQLFRTPFWLEGWALYWEMLLWDLDFPKSAEDRIGMLFWRKHRCARIIFSLSYHLETMTPEECIDFLVERVGHERNNATAEVRRSVMGGYGPLYQAAYMLGGLQIRALRQELVDSNKMSNRQFHDMILHQNSIPIEMVRARLAEIPLEKDHESSWRFND